MAGDHEVRVAAPVLFEGFTSAVKGIAVDFDDEPLQSPERIDLVPGESGVGLRPGQPRSLDQSQKPALGLRSRRTGIHFKDRAKRGCTPTAAARRQIGRADEARYQRLIDRLRELAGIRSGEVVKRTHRARHPHTLAAHDLAIAELVEVDPQAGPTATMRTAQGHVHRSWPGGHESEDRGGAPVAQHRSGSTREQRGPLTAEFQERRWHDRVHAAVHDEQAPGRDPMLDGCRRQPRIEK